MREDVAKPDQRRQADATALQIVDQLLQVDRPARVLGRMDLDLPVLADREVSVPPPGDLVQLGGIGNGPGLAHVVGGTSLGKRMIHGPRS